MNNIQAADFISSQNLTIINMYFYMSVSNNYMCTCNTERSSFKDFPSVIYYPFIVNGGRFITNYDLLKVEL